MTSIEKPGRLDTDEEEPSSLYKHDKARQDELTNTLCVSASPREKK
ncbi:hypothetical protein [Dolichospermum circinale]|nr:hypothetical protein [Dolichospermum circinale]